MARLRGEPTPPPENPEKGKKLRWAHQQFGTSPNVLERAIEDPAPLAKHFTNFKHDFDKPQVPTVIRGGRVGGNGRRRLNVKLPADRDE